MHLISARRIDPERPNHRSKPDEPRPPAPPGPGCQRGAREGLSGPPLDAVRPRQALLLPREGHPRPGRRGEAEGQDRERHGRDRDRERRADAPRVRQQVLLRPHSRGGVRLRALLRQARRARRVGEEAAPGDAVPRGSPDLEPGRDERAHARPRARRRSLPRPRRPGPLLRAPLGELQPELGDPPRGPVHLLPVLRREAHRLQREGLHRGARQVPREEARRLAELPEQPVRLHADEGGGRRDREGAHRGGRGGHAARRLRRRRVLRDAVRRRVREGVALRPAREGVEQPPRDQDSTARRRRSSSGGSASGSSPSA